MELITMAAVNILFLALVCIGVILERRISKLELEREMTIEREQKEREEILARLTELEKRQSSADDEIPEKDILAEKKFAKGVENILNYALSFPAVKEDA